MHALPSAALALLLVLLALRPTREWLLTLVLYLVLGVYTHAIQWTQRPPPVTLAARQATGHLPLPTLDWRDPNASATVTTTSTVSLALSVLAASLKYLGSTLVDARPGCDGERQL